MSMYVQTWQKLRKWCALLRPMGCCGVQVSSVAMATRWHFTSVPEWMFTTHCFSCPLFLYSFPPSILPFPPPLQPSLFLLPLVSRSFRSVALWRMRRYQSVSSFEAGAQKRCIVMPRSTYELLFEASVAVCRLA